jgi:aryl-alcohol dehydrogenase-like predicted oxidoreductase
MQDHYSLVARAVERELVPALKTYGLGLIPYFPLAGGLLTGKYRDAVPPPETGRLATSPVLGRMFLSERNLALAAGYRAFCEARGRTLTELAFAWLLAREPVCSVIAGASSVAQLEINAAALGWQLSADELAEIDRLSGLEPDPYAH